MHINSKQSAAPFHPLFLVAIIFAFFVSSCNTTGNRVAAGPESLPTIVPTAASPTISPAKTAVATATTPATATTIPTAVPTQTNTPTAQPTATATPSPTVTSSPTPTHTPEPINRACPDPAPLKPAYNAYYLSPERWPTPDWANADPHFWLAKPLPGGGRLLANKTYPYGHDGNGRYLLHNGVDTAEKLGTPVLAVADGTIIVAQSDAQAWYGWRCDWYGHLAVIQLDQIWQGEPLFALYGHILNINVEVGQHVTQGEQIAEVGVGGAATVPHLHFELRSGENSFDSTRNPMLWIHPGQTRGVIAGRLIDPQGRPWQGVTLTLISEDATLINSWSYLDDPLDMINPDEQLAENFVFSDVLPGKYDIYVKLQGVEYRQPIQVNAAEITTIEIVTEPFKTATPSPASQP